MNGVANNAAVLDALIDAINARAGQKGASLSVGVKHTTPSGTASTPYMHGPNGLWSVSGLERDIISTRVQPRGLAGALPARGTNIMNPLFPYLTGFVEGTGTNPSGPCDDGPVAGAMKNCLQTAAFGRYTYMTRELDITRVGQQINRGEFMDLRLVNDSLLAPGFNGNGVVVPNVPGGNALISDIVGRFIEVGISFQNKLSRQLYTGNPANNNGGGGYSEFPGLDILVGTDKVDAITGQNCPSLDSDIKDFNYGRVTTMSGSEDIVNVLTYLMRTLRSNAERSGLAPTTWAIVMRETLFYELTAVWACSYMSYRCSPRTGTSSNIDAGDMIAMRDAMRNEQFLMIDGIRVAVILDDAISEETSTDTSRVTGGSYASDIYVIPLSVRGDLAVTYWEYFDFQGAGAAASAIQQGPLLENYFWTDGGRYLWHAKPPKNWCVQWIGLIEPRLIFRTPHLAGRITNVQYTPLQHTRDAFPDQPYFVNGGVTSRDTAPSWYSDWNPS